MNVKLTVQYDGTNYHGWQIQKNGNTVQQTIMDAVKKITGEIVTVKGCGRTDSGVHAENYVCNFYANASVPAQKYVYALNSVLPSDIVCKQSDEVDDDFCANRNICKKRYVYRILNTEFPDAFMRNYVWHYKHTLDVEKMRHEAQAFIGTHDFIGFAASGFTVKTTVRTIYSLDILEDNGLITIDISGNGFLYNMVRIIAGTLVQIGGGMFDNAEGIIASCDRERAGITAPACGLSMKEVFYNG